jgi:hypothetical protein
MTAMEGSVVVMRWRTAGWVAVTVFVGLVAPVAVAAAGIAGATGGIYAPRDTSAPPARVEVAAAPVHDPGKPTAVVVLGSEGANVADALAPMRCWFPISASGSWTSGCPRAPRWSWYHS